MTCHDDGGASACPENWEMRQMYIVDATPAAIASAHNGTCDHDTVIYIDARCGSNRTLTTYDAARTAMAASYLLADLSRSAGA